MDADHVQLMPVVFENGKVNGDVSLTSGINLTCKGSDGKVL